MGLFFGTDGLRGIVNKDLTQNIAFKIGNALAVLKKNPKVLIGSDTRISGSYIALGVASGVMAGGGFALDLGVVPTAGVAYLTKTLGYDYGVVISASHNSGEYNGIKVFGSEGYKLGEKEEEQIERCFLNEKINAYPNIGTYRQDLNAIKLYRDYLISSSKNTFEGLTVVLDCAYGASHKIAPEVFKRLGAKVIASNAQDNGLKINDKCGALYPENLKGRIKRYKADIGFAFDGDSDRLIVVDENGNVVNGDVIISSLAKYYKSLDKLKEDTVVGTSHTNMGIEAELKENGIKLIRTDIGDKYVLAKLVEKNLSLGGEQSGHIILKELATTGDGILSAIAVLNMLIDLKKKASEVFKANLYPQVNINVIVGDKFKVLNSELLSKAVVKHNIELEGKGRIMIRASGTEPKIRIMVESKDREVNEKIALDLEKIVRNVDIEN